MAGSDSELHAQSVQCARRNTKILYSIVQLLFQFIGGVHFCSYTWYAAAPASISGASLATQVPIEKHPFES